jgi:nitroimidazol reductase NimA-like FMN-containing flavoprotein (pyridoxamine 5'-phosphate oxidase superfamily)
MASRRDQITMTPDEVAAFLDAQKHDTIGTVDSHDFAHVVNVVFIVEDGRVAFTSFRASQKVKNLERTGKATALIEIIDPYLEIRGVMISGAATVIDDRDAVAALQQRIRTKRSPEFGTAPGLPQPMEVDKYADKRVAVYIEPDRVRSWDHSKLGGTY